MVRPYAIIPKRMSDQPHREKGLVLVISGPSGVGKTSIVRELVGHLAGRFSVSATTRARTEGEEDGTDYFFLREERFQEMIDEGEFLEYAQVFGKDWYGTPREPVQAAVERGELVVLDIDVQGGLQVRSCLPEALLVFVLPPSDEELLRRLRTRGREVEQAIMRRFEEAKKEITLARTSQAYDHMIVNDDLERAIEEACSLVTQRCAGP